MQREREERSTMRGPAFPGPGVGVQLRFLRACHEDHLQKDGASAQVSADMLALNGIGLFRCTFGHKSSTLGLTSYYILLSIR